MKEKSKAVKTLIVLAWLAVPVLVGLVTFAVGIVLRETQDTAWTWALIAFVIALVVLLLVWLGVYLYKKAKADKLEKTLGQGGGAQLDQKGEIEALRKRWKESVSMLKSAGGKSGLGEFPWFAIIGAPASGKSTLLRQSEIDFPVGDAAVKGLHGTRNCDWWFSNVGIFLDTAGRYMSDESAKEWTTFLELLRRLRSEAPINGVLVAVPVPDLLTKNGADLDSDARRIRARLDELIDGLGINFPVWIILTKVDLIAGFVEFFGKADARTRRQMMGWTTEQTEGLRFDRSQYDARFDGMIERLRSIRPSMVGSAALRDRPAAYHFPEEFSSLQGPLGDFVQRVFEPNVYQETPFYRGVYVTSATQQGTPLQRAAEQVRNLLGLGAAAPDPQQSVIANSYFLRDLVNERVVTDRGLVWTTATEIGRGRLVRLGKNLTGMAVGVLLFMLVLAFGMRAGRELDEIEVPEDAPSAVAACDGLWIAAARASDSNYRNLGLSQQKSLKLDLGEKQAEVYHAAVLLPLVSRIEEDLRAVSVDEGLAGFLDEWERFEVLRSALDRAAEPMAPMPVGEETEGGEEAGDGEGDGGEEDDGEEDDGEEKEGPGDEGRPDDAVAADADTAPKGFFRKAEIAALEQMQERLVDDGIVVEPGAKDGAGRRDLPDRLLDSLWRNGTGAARERLDGARAVLLEKCGEWLAHVAKETAARKEYRDQKRGNIEEWRTDFERRCSIAADALGGDVESREVVEKALLPLLQRASQSPDEDDEKNLPFNTALLGAAPGELSRLESGVLTADEMAGLPAYTAVKESFEPQTEEAATEEAQHRQELENALGELAKALAWLHEQVRKNGFVEVPWPTRFNELEDAVGYIREEVREKDVVWRARVVAPLMVLAGEKDAELYKNDRDRWGRAVEVLDAALRRNDLLDAFFTVKGPGGYRDLAAQLVRERRSEAEDGTGARSLFNQRRMQNDLQELAKPSAIAFDRSLWPRVAKSVREQARRTLDEQFSKLLNIAQQHWDAHCKSNLPNYGGSPFEFLRQWTEPQGPVGLVAKSVVKNFEDEWEAPDDLKENKAAEDAWKPVAAYRDRYAFFWRKLPPLQGNLRKLLAHEKVSLQKGRSRSDLEALNDELERSGAPAVWAPGSAFTDVHQDVISAGHRKSLVDALKEAEQELLGRLERYYSTYWIDVRSEIVAKVAAPTVANIKEARRLFYEFRGDLALLFTEALGEDRGPGLTVKGAFLNTDTALRNYFDLQRDLAAGFTITLTQDSLPTGSWANKTPYMQLVYTANGKPIESDRMPPNGDVQFSLAWDPASAESFEIRMVGENDKDKLTFAVWLGHDCILKALKAGNDVVPAQELVFEGSKRFEGATARLLAEYSKPELIKAAEQWLNNASVLEPAEGCVDLKK